MKKRFLFPIMLFIAFGFHACNDGDKDSVDQANEANEKKDTLVNDNTVNTTTNVLPEEGSKFMVEAASGGMMEVEAGYLAKLKGKNPRVKKFGAMMVEDHSKANAEMKTLASLKNVTLPAMMGEDHVKQINDLKEKNGADFDKAYMSMMVDDHEKDIKEFEKCVSDSHDEDLKAFTSKVLPTLRIHLDSAKSIRDAVKR